MTRAGMPAGTPLHPIAADPELGRVRWCPTCAEWWPDDAEFWEIVGRPGDVKRSNGRTYTRHSTVYRCKGHIRSSGTNAKQLDAFRQRIRAPRPAFGLCAVCLAVRTPRKICHGCAQRVDGPLTVERLTAFGLAAPV